MRSTPVNPDNDPTRLMRTRLMAVAGDRPDDVITLALHMPSRLNDAATVISIAPAIAPTPAPGGPPAAAGDSTAARVRYAILGEAGRGGMATVHVARDLELMRKVALKQLADDLAGAEPARLRFLREVQITAQLDHPHIVPVYGLEVSPGGAPAYAMKLVEGVTLADLLRACRDAHAGGRAPDESQGLGARLEHFLKVCDAVDYAHGKGVIHRDLKPANIMIGPHREIYVMDWGICRLFDQDDPEAGAREGMADSTGGNQTEFGSVIGTPRYMSPEQAQGRSDELGPRSDQCALGLMLFELVTLRAPFDGDTALKVLEQAAHARRAAITHAYEHRPIAAPLRAIIERATRYDPQQRYASVCEFADDIRRFLRGEAVHALPDSPWQRAQRFVGRHRQGMLLAMLALVALTALGFTGLLWRHEQALLATQARERHERELIDAVVRHGDRLQLELLALQSKVDALATAATQLLKHGSPAADARVYWAEDYLDAAHRPPDYAMRPALGYAASLQWAVWDNAEGSDRGALGPQLQRLFHLRDYRNELLEMAARSLGGGGYTNGVVEIRLALETGLFMRYPGRVLEHRLDLREAAWYRTAMARPRAQWGVPFIDAEGDNVLLPLSAALRGPDGTLLGALSMDLALDFLVHNTLRDDDGRELLLLDRDGLLLASEDVLQAQASPQGVIALASFGDAALRRAFESDDVGVVATRLGGQPRLVAFDRIHPLEWILVLVAPDPDAR